MAVIVMYFLPFVHCVHTLFDGSQQSYVNVPHAEIASNETFIDLYGNSLTFLNPNEFSTYSELETLTLSNNEIEAVSPSAFTGTKLRTLKIGNNLLADIPDLIEISTTLKELNLRGNPLIAFPNITMTGADATLSFKNTSGLADMSSLSTVCSIGSLNGKTAS